jgi:hypothetical protein
MVGRNNSRQTIPALFDISFSFPAGAALCSISFAKESKDMATKTVNSFFG